MIGRESCGPIRSVCGPGAGAIGRKRRLVRIVALDALAPRLLALRRIPVAVRAAVRTVLPVAIHRPVALGTQQLRLVPGDLAAGVVHEGVAIRPVMAVEATRVDPVLQLNLRVLRQRPVRLRRRRNDPVTVAAAIRVDTGGVSGPAWAAGPASCPSPRPERRSPAVRDS